jgi:hypothetical protein
MPSYRVTIESGATFDQWGDNAQAAMLTVEELCNRAETMSAERADILISEGAGYWRKTEGGIKPANATRAVSAEEYKTDYVACGAYMSPTGRVELRA